MCKGANVAVNTLCNVKFTLRTSADGRNIFDEISIDTELEVESCSENLDGGTRLDTDAKGSLEGC